VPSRKQRRRRQKERRHDWEYVYVDDEGREVEVDEESAPAAPQARSQGGQKGQKAGSRTGARPGRRVEPASWSRVGKRALFLGPVMFILINLVGHKLTVGQRIYQTAVLLLIFLPFSYFMDSMMYRAYLKRTGAAPPPRRRGSNGSA
jgi:hypothetical protein